MFKPTFINGGYFTMHMSCAGLFCPSCISDMIKYYLRLTKDKNGYYFARKGK